MATNRISVTGFDGEMTMASNRGAICSCGQCGEKIRKGDIGYRFTVKGTSKWFTTACYESMKFTETDSTSDYDAIHTINHEMKIVCNDKNEAIIKMLQGFHVTKGFGKNAGKYYCTLKGNESCYSTGHFVNGGEVRVNGKTVNSLAEFREATH